MTAAGAAALCECARRKSLVAGTPTPRGCYLGLTVLHGQIPLPQLQCAKNLRFPDGSNPRSETRCPFSILTCFRLTLCKMQSRSCGPSRALPPCPATTKTHTSSGYTFSPKVSVCFVMDALNNLQETVRAGVGRGWGASQCTCSCITRHQGLPGCLRCECLSLGGLRGDYRCCCGIGGCLPGSCSGVRKIEWEGGTALQQKGT